MDKRVAVLYNVTGQELELYPVEGVPSAAATYSCWLGARGDDETVEFSGTATADTFSQAITTASGYSQTNRRRLYVTTTTGLVVGRFYRIENAVGQFEIVRCVAISAAAYIDVEFDLAYDYPITTSTLKGFRQVFTVPSAFVQTESKMNAEEYPYRVRWDYTVGGVSRRALQWFDLVREAPGDGVRDADVTQAWPSLAYQMATARRDAILAEARTMVDRDLRIRKQDPARLAGGPVRDALVKAAFCVQAVKVGEAIPQGHDAASALRFFTRDYLDTLEQAVLAGTLEQAENRGDGNRDPEPRRPLMFDS